MCIVAVVPLESDIAKVEIISEQFCIALMGEFRQNIGGGELYCIYSTLYIHYALSQGLGMNFNNF